MWENAQTIERNWWGTCSNTLGEEIKQLVYARFMGLEFIHNGASPYNIDLKGASVLDIGGGPTSLLLKSFNGKYRAVVDPCDYPLWTKLRYSINNIDYIQEPAEKLSFFSSKSIDEIWMYNVLEHVENPGTVLSEIKRIGKRLRLFEWLNDRINDAHIHILTEDLFKQHLGDGGKTKQLAENGCHGLAYYGVFTI